VELRLRGGISPPVEFVNLLFNNQMQQVYDKLRQTITHVVQLEQIASELGGGNPRHFFLLICKSFHDAERSSAPGGGRAASVAMVSPNARCEACLDAMVLRVAAADSRYAEKCVAYRIRELSHHGRREEYVRPNDRIVTNALRFVNGVGTLSWGKSERQVEPVG
jgi:hypothetical protein